MSPFLRLAAAFAACLTLMCLPSAAGAETSLPAGFVAEPLATGLDQPTGFAFRPDGVAYVIEKAGRVYRVTPSGAKTLWLDLNASSAVPPVNAWWDRGLVGIAIDGQWPAQSFVYLLYVSDGWSDGADGYQDDDPHSSLLVRVPVAPDGSAGTPVPILGKDGMGVACPGPHNVGEGPGGTTLDSGDYNGSDCLPIDGDTHAVGTVRSAPDGTLYLGNGDGAPWDGLDKRTLRPQREDTFAGKIIRVDRDGKGLPGHPFCPSVTDLTKTCAKLHAKGFRNPFRFALAPDGRLVVGDVGWGSREELTVVPAGANGGWPCWEGTHENDNYSWHSLCAPAVTTTRPRQPVGVTMPIWEYDRVGLGGAVVGGPVYTGTSYPAAYRGALLVGDYAQGWLRFLPSDGATGWNTTPSLVTDWAATSAGPLAGTAFGRGALDEPWTGVDLGAHPANGDVVYADIGQANEWGGIEADTGRLVRIRYAPGNARPVARATATPDSGEAPLDVTLSAATSSDPDGDQLTYAWDVDGNGTTDATTATVSHRYLVAGSYNAKVTVSDGHGLTHSATVQVRVSETPPEAEILATSDTTFAGGQPIALRGRAADLQDGALTGSALRWDVQLIHNDHTHLLGTYYGTAPAVPNGIDDHDSDSRYEITLTATDSAGLTDKATWRLDPRTATIKLRSEPAGARMNYGERPFDAPVDHPSTIGLKTSVAPVASFVKSGATYVFERWDSGSTTRVRALTVPQAGATLTARYNGVPTARAAVKPVADPRQPLQRSLSAAASSDPDGDRLTCAWDLDGDDTTDRTGCEIDVTYATAGARVAALTVSDGRGQQDADEVTVEVNSAPTAAITSAPAAYSAGEALTLRGAATDPDGGGAPALTWSVQRTVDGAASGAPIRGAGAELALPASAANEPGGAYVATLTATDDDGAVDTALATIRPRTADVELRSAPGGATFSLEGRDIGDGVRRTAVVGAEVRAAAPAEITSGGAIFRFSEWDDRIPSLARGLRVPMSGITLTARYAAVPTIGATDAQPAPEPRPDPPVSHRPAAGRVTLDAVRRARALPRRLSGALVGLPTVNRVDVAVERRRGAKCAWWSRLRGVFAAARSCAVPTWHGAGVTADGARWTLRLGGALPPGAITIRLRALNERGAVLARRTTTVTITRTGGTR